MHNLIKTQAQNIGSIARERKTQPYGELKLNKCNMFVILSEVSGVPSPLFHPSANTEYFLFKDLTICSALIEDWLIIGSVFIRMMSVMSTTNNIIFQFWDTIYCLIAFTSNLEK